MIYGYIRVSSKTQEDNNSRTSQLVQIMDKAKTIVEQDFIYKEPTLNENKRGKIIEVFDHDNTIVQEVISGGIHHLKRPEFMKIYNRIQSGDSLIVAKIDRLAQNQQSLLEIIADLRARNIAIYFLDLPMDLNKKDANGRYDYMAEMMLQMIGSIAQMEKERIRERREEGIRLALERQRTTGKKIFGRPKTYQQNCLDHAIYLLKEHSYSEVVRLTGISKSTIIREVRRLRLEEEK